MSGIGKWFRHAWIVLLVASVVILLDQWTKTLVRTNLAKFVEVEVIGRYLMLQHVDNYGAAFGIFQSGGMIFALVATVVTIGVMWYVTQIPVDRVLIRVLLGLQVGGAVGNLIDRFQQGFVTDFIKMGIPGLYYWPIWNIADASIVIGVVGLGIYIIWEDTVANRNKTKMTVTEVDGHES
jgi:signal peptidase II